MSVVTYGELRVGAERATGILNPSRRSSFSFKQCQVLPIDPEVARFYSKVRLDLEQRGQIIGANDLWIASHCLQLGLTLVTNNEREFSRIPNLTIENWTR